MKVSASFGGWPNVQRFRRWVGFCDRWLKRARLFMARNEVVRELMNVSWALHKDNFRVMELKWLDPGG